MKHLLGTALFSLCLASTGHATQSDSYLDSFAKGMELTTTSAGIQTLLLPESVYRGISSPSLGDLRVTRTDFELDSKRVAAAAAGSGSGM